ncbi:MAG: glycosyltransferase family 4 protein, partial [Planctomycetota bacterium]
MVDRDKIGFISAPWTSVPSAELDSFGLLVDRISRSLPPSCEAVVVSGVNDGSANQEAEGITYHHTLDWRDRYGYNALAFLCSLVPSSTRAYLFRSFFHRGYARRAAAFFQKNRVGSVVFPDHPQWAEPLRVALPDARLILWVQNELPCSGPAKFAENLKRIDRVVCSSNYIAQKMAARFPGIRDRLRIIPFGVDTTRFTPSAKQLRHVILYAGRLAPERGVHVMFKIFKQVREHFPDALLVMAGPVQLTPPPLLFCQGSKKDVKSWIRMGAHYEALLRKETQRLEGVFLPGRVDQSSMLKLYRTATLFVFPCLWNEPFGHVLPEAMACGLPIVASRCGGIPETIEDGRSGILRDRGDVDAWVAAIERIFDNRDLAARMSASARNRAEESFDWKRV